VTEIVKPLIETPRKEYKTIGTNTKAARTQNQTIQTDGKYFTE
jgi:hypothetical protein